MKICLINNTYNSKRVSGSKRIVEILKKGLEERGEDVFVITTKKKNFFLKNSYSYKDNIYYFSSFFSQLDRIPKVLRLFWHICDLFDFKTAYRIKKIIKKEKTDLVITHNLKGLSYLLPFFLKSKKIKHIHYLHDIQLIHPSGLLIFNKEYYILKSFFARIYARIVSFLFFYVDVVISPSKWLLELHENFNFFDKSLKVNLENPIVLDRDKKDRDKFVKNPRQFSFLFVGQLDFYKGIFFLLDNFGKILDKWENEIEIKLDIIGDGAGMQKVKQILESQNLDKNIFLHGILDNEKVQEKMQKADLLVIPSLCYENSPTVIYEAINQKLPVLATKLGGNIELIESLGGFLYEANSSSDFLDMVDKILEKRDNLMQNSEISYQKITAYSLSNYLNKLFSLIKND